MPLIFILMAASTSHFLTAAIKFSFYSSYVITLLCYLSLFLLQMLKFKLSQKKELALLLLLFFISEVQVAMRFTTEMFGYVYKIFLPPTG